ncbi:MAG: pilus assembly protein [Pseudomonadota bacterium]
MGLSSNRILTSFSRDERGVVAMIFGLTCVMLLLLAGLAIDVGRAIHTSTRLSAALDSAALAGAKALRLQGLTETEASELTRRMFEANYKDLTSFDGKITNLSITADASKSKVEITAETSVGMHLAKLAGINTMDFERTATAIFEAKDIEVAVQLDVTGSMCNPCSKIADLKSATKTLVDVLIPEEQTGQKIRIAYAPFSAGVNAGSYLGAVSGGDRTSDRCTYERKEQGFQFTDQPPVGEARLQTTEDLSDAIRCSRSAPILPMTDDKELLKSTVDRYTTGGYTAGHLGTAWSWYLLSPQWGSIFPQSARPAEYNDGGTVKVAILMTDGEYNTVEGKSGNAGKSSDFAKATCSAMKAKKIIIYTVGFKLSAGSNARETLEECASGPGKAYSAEDGAALNAAFRDIAEDITNLRLSN